MLCKHMTDLSVLAMNKRRGLMETLVPFCYIDRRNTIILKFPFLHTYDKI